MELLFELLDAVGDGFGTTTGPVGGTISVAIIVACVAGTALGWLLHMAYALATVSAIQGVSLIIVYLTRDYDRISPDLHPALIPSQALIEFSATMH